MVPPYEHCNSLAGSVLACGDDCPRGRVSPEGRLRRRLDNVRTRACRPRGRVVSSAASDDSRRVAAGKVRGSQLRQQRPRRLPRLDARRRETRLQAHEGAFRRARLEARRRRVQPRHQRLRRVHQGIHWRPQARTVRRRLRVAPRRLPQGQPESEAGHLDKACAAHRRAEVLPQPRTVPDAGRPRRGRSASRRAESTWPLRCATTWTRSSRATTYTRLPRARRL